MSEIEERHRRKHDHTDSTGRCSACGRFLPKWTLEASRFVCDCGKAHFEYRGKATSD